MRVWRLARAVHPVLDGEGARRFGGHWKEVGTAIVYTAATLSLAVLEQLVHLDPDLMPADMAAFEIEVPNELEVAYVAPDDLPEVWNRAASCKTCREIGQRWVQEAGSAVLSVPSALVLEERNYLINPAHPEASHVQVVRSRPYAFDPRLLRR